MATEGDVLTAQPTGQISLKTDSDRLWVDMTNEPGRTAAKFKPRNTTLPHNTPGGLFRSLEMMFWSRLGNRASRPGAGTGRVYSQKTASGNSKHSEWYRDMIPGMIPIALLGSTVYLGLQLARAKFSHEKQVTEAQERVSQLEARLKRLESEIENVSVERVELEEKPTGKSWWRG